MLKDLLFIDMCVCLSVCTYLWKPEEGFGYHGAGGTGDCELSDMGTGNLGLVPTRAEGVPNHWEISSALPHIF